MLIPLGAIWPFVALLRPEMFASLELDCVGEISNKAR
jgi:hypothetical protein